MESKISLNDAVEALRNKEKPRAREILDAVIRQDPQNDMAWLYMALAVENRKQALACLERATQINPANNKAWELLEKLESSQPQGKSTARKGKSNPLKFALIGVGSLLVIVILLIGGLLISGYFNGGPSVAAIPPSATVSEADISPQAGTTPTRNMPPTWTPQPTWTPTSVPLRRSTPTPRPTPTITMYYQGRSQDYIPSLREMPEGFDTNYSQSGPLYVSDADFYIKLYYRLLNKYNGEVVGFWGMVQKPGKVSLTLLRISDLLCRRDYPLNVVQTIVNVILRRI